MSFRSLIAAVLAVVAVFAATPARVASAATTTAPSSTPPKVILFIVADDLGWDDVGFRSHQINTPNIDGFRHDGLMLNHYYVQARSSINVNATSLARAARGRHH